MLSVSSREAAASSSPSAAAAIAFARAAARAAPAASPLLVHATPTEDGRIHDHRVHSVGKDGQSGEEGSLFPRALLAKAITIILTKYMAAEDAGEGVIVREG